MSTEMSISPKAVRRPSESADAGQSAKEETMYNLIYGTEVIPAAEQTKRAETIAQHRAAYRARREERRSAARRHLLATIADALTG
jgi:hypothetical protein